MFKKIREKIQKALKERAKRQELIRQHKKAEIRGAVIKFYEDKDITDGAVNIPAFMRADKTIAEVIKTDKDIDYYYKRLLKYRAATRYSY